MGIRSCVAGLGLALAGWCVQAAEIVVAQVGPMTGPLAVNGVANYLGAKAYFDQLNAEGGINGNKIRFIREDDQYKPDETIRLLSAVAERDKPIAFINLLGSANVSAVLKDKTIDRLAVPVVGVTPGADSLRNPGSPWIFHTHASDNAQLKRMLTHLSTLGLNRIAVVYQDLPFGKGGMAFIDENVGPLKMTVTGRVAVPPAADDLKPAAVQLAKAGAQAYLMILAPNSGTAMIRDVRSSGDATPIYGLSYVPVKGIVEKGGLTAAVGVALAQITPNAATSTTGITRQFHAAMDKYAPQGTDHSQLHLVGYLAARVTAEGIRRAGANPTPEKLAAALRNVKMDLGGYTVDFAGGNVGSQFVDIGVIDRNGRLMY